MLVETDSSGSSSFSVFFAAARITGDSGVDCGGANGLNFFSVISEGISGFEIFS